MDISTVKYLLSRVIYFSVSLSIKFDTGVPNDLLLLAGFDGQLSAVINSGSADIHLSRITGNSEISLKHGNNFVLKLTDSCQENTGLKIFAHEVILPKILKYQVDRSDDCIILKPNVEPEHMVNINCSNSKITLENTSWEDMMKMKIKNK